jgi:hypothetical protein
MYPNVVLPFSNVCLIDGAHVNTKDAEPKSLYTSLMAACGLSHLNVEAAVRITESLLKAEVRLMLRPVYAFAKTVSFFADREILVVPPYLHPNLKARCMFKLCWEAPPPLLIPSRSSLR